MTDQDQRAWELQPLREIFLACFSEAHGAALRQLGMVAHGLAMTSLPLPENGGSFRRAELQAVALDLRYVQRYLETTMAENEDMGLSRRREKASRRLAERWARRVGALAGDIEREILQGHA